MPTTPVFTPTLTSTFQDWKTWIQQTPPGPVGPPPVENVVAFKIVSLSFLECMYAFGILNSTGTHSVLSGLASLGEDDTVWEQNTGWKGNPFDYPGFATQRETTARLVIENGQPAINMNVTFMNGSVPMNVNVNLVATEGKDPYLGIETLLSGSRTDTPGKVLGSFYKSTFVPGARIGG